VIPDTGQGHVHPGGDQTGGFRRVRDYYHCCYCDRYKRKIVLIAAGVASFRVAAGRREYRARDNRNDSGALRFPRLYLLCHD
jgi:hypothetical protein